MGSHGELPATVPRGSHLHAAPTHAHVRGCQWDHSLHASWPSFPITYPSIFIPSIPIPYPSIFIPSIPIPPSPSLHPFSYNYATSLHPRSFHLHPSIPNLSILIPPSPYLYLHTSILIHLVPIPPSTSLHPLSLQLHPFISTPSIIPSSPSSSLLPCHPWLPAHAGSPVGRHGSGHRRRVGSGHSGHRPHSPCSGTAPQSCPVPRPCARRRHLHPASLPGHSHMLPRERIVRSSGCWHQEL